MKTIRTPNLLCGRNREALKEVWASDYCSWGEDRERGKKNEIN